MRRIDLSDDLFSKLEMLAQARDIDIANLIQDLLASETSQFTQKQDESFYQAIFNSTHDAVLVIDKNSNYVDVNPAATEMLGYSRSEFLALKPADILLESLDVRNEVIQRFREEGSARVTCKLRHKDGGVVYAEFSSVRNVIDGHHVALVRDVTQRVLATQALICSEQYLQTIYEDARVPLFSINVDEDGEFTFDTLSYYHLKALGASHDQVVGKRPQDLPMLSAEDTTALRASYQRCYEEGKTIIYEGQFVVDGKESHWLTRLAPVRDANGRIYRLIGLSFDLTDRLEAEREKQRAEILSLQLDNEKELSTYKAQVTSMLAHEFQTPLSVINSSLYLMQKNIEKFDEQKLQTRMTKISEQVNRLYDLMDNLIRVNHSSIMEQDLYLTPINLSGFLLNILDDLLVSFPYGADIRFEFLRDDNVFVTDEELLRQIVTNLLTNALKYSDSDSTIWLRCKNDNDTLRLTVQDQGMGIPKDEQSHIFNFFRRGSNATEQEGIGIGLMVVKQAVQRLGGEIVLNSDVGVGTRVCVNLPIKMLEAID